MLPTSLLLLILAWPAAANTEIVNFFGRENHDLSIQERDKLGWQRLSYPAHVEQLLFLTPAPVPEGSSWEAAFPVSSSQNLSHELWVILDLDSFSASALWDQHMYTLRLSWPAWSPVDFELKIHDSDGLAEHNMVPSHSASGPVTRSHYARIRAKNAGVHRNESYRQEGVPFYLTLEKLYFGFLPPSVVPTLLAIVVSLVPSYFAARQILRLLSNTIERSSHELRSTTEVNKDD